MKYWVISDTHFSHAKMHDWGIRPLNYEDQIEQSLLAIPSEDVLIHLGDICMGNDATVHERFIQPLKCKKWLARGNHDNKSNGWYLNHGWDFVSETFVDEYFGKRIIFSHKPINFGDAPLDFNVHGHLHNNTHRQDEAINDGKHLLVSLELQGCTAKTLDHFLHGIYKI